jgi:hypothetical protein
MRICPRCHAQQLDENQDQCKNCNARFINLADAIYLDKSQLNEIADDIIKSPRVLLTIVLFIVVVGFLVNEFAESKVSKSIAEMKEKTDAQLAAAYKEITNEIVVGFQQPRIKDVMMQVAASQASNLLVQQISPEIGNFRSGTSKTLSQFNDSFLTFQKQATNALADLRSTTEFSLLVTRAFSDDYLSFVQLHKIEQDTNSVFKNEASRTHRTLTSRLAMAPANLDNLNLDWKAIGVDLDKDSLKQLTQQVESEDQTTVDNRAILLRLIMQNERFPKFDRINFVISIMTNSPSITLRNEACYLLYKESNINHALPEGISIFLEWWKTNGFKYTNSGVVGH